MPKELGDLSALTHLTLLNSREIAGEFCKSVLKFGGIVPTESISWRFNSTLVSYHEMYLSPHDKRAAFAPELENLLEWG